MSNGQPPKSNAGTWAAVLGGLAVVGGIAAAAVGSGSKKSPTMSGPRPQSRFKKKPCGCGR